MSEPMRWRKTLDAMENNPRADWRIEDLERICNQLKEFGVTMSPPRRGSHYTVRHAKLATILTVPAHRPIKAVYVKRFVDMIRSIIDGTADDPNLGTE